MWRELTLYEKEYSVLLDENFHNNMDDILIKHFYNNLNKKIVDEVYKEYKKLKINNTEILNNLLQQQKDIAKSYGFNLTSKEIEDLYLNRSSLQMGLNQAQNVYNNQDLIEYLWKKIKGRTFFYVKNQIYPLLEKYLPFTLGYIIKGINKSIYSGYIYSTYLNSLLKGDLPALIEKIIIRNIVYSTMDYSYNIIKRFLNIESKTKDKNLIVKKIKEYNDKYAFTNAQKTKTYILYDIFSIGGSDFVGVVVSEILDKKICDFCRYVTDKMKIRKSAKWLKDWFIPYHPNCRAVFLPIFKKDLPVNWDTNPGFTPKEFFLMSKKDREHIINKYKKIKRR